MTAKTLWNPNGVDSLEETLVDGDPTGMLNMNRSRYKWADSLWKQMLANTWFPEEVATGDDKKKYAQLSDGDKRKYDLVFSQLSFNDSLQAENLIDNINRYVTNKMVNALLCRQAYEEVLHSSSYAVLLSDVVEDSDGVFDLYRTDLTLRAKNTIIADNYKALTIGEVTKEKFFYACIANQILEGVYFLSGFMTIYSLTTMRGSSDMISFIHRDENTHLALFSNMIRVMTKEEDLMWFRIRPKVVKMFDDAYKLEVSWMKYINPELAPELIEASIAYLVKDRMKMIGFYDEEEDKYAFGRKTSLVKKLEEFGSHNDQKTNFFEGTVKNYSKGSLEFQDDWAECTDMFNIEHTVEGQTFMEAMHDS